MVDRHKFVMTDASAETIKKFWNCYHAYRYDFNCSFTKFLQENGICATVASPYFSPFGYNLDDIEVSLN
jgi:hypothetical protein